MASALFVHRLLLGKGQAPSGRAVTRCYATTKLVGKRWYKRKIHLAKFVPVVVEEEDAKKAQPKSCSLSNEQLDEMYDKKYYNSELWMTVLKRQLQRLKKPPLPPVAVGDFVFSPLAPKKPDPVLSYAAQAILEDAGCWRGELTQVTDGKLDQGPLLPLPKGEPRYPFAMVKPANEVSDTVLRELVELEAGDEAVEVTYEEQEEAATWQSGDSKSLSKLAETVREVEDTLDDMNDSEAAERPFDELSVFSPDYVETIELKNPHAEEVYRSEIERIDKYRLQAMFGSPNPDVPSTNMPCGGCGAIMHCHDSAIPGYLPSELIEGRTFLELQDTICQRCNFLRNYDVALNVSVSSSDYVRVISEIQEKNALVLLMVDLLDFPCSIWPGIIDLVGPSRPLVVVGNKVDLLPKDDAGYLERIKKCLEQSLKDFGVDTGKNIKHLALISAKTGYGIEELITQLQHHWGVKGDVYVIGCTNVGKSSLFNALLQSDLCKSQALDIIQRATVSLWPGTTLKLLKFPLLNPTPWRTFLRVKRLQAASFEYAQERVIRRLRLKETRNPAYAALIGNIGMTFKSDPLKQSIATASDPFNMSMSVQSDLPKIRLKKFRESDPAFAEGKWFYDTPGAVHHDQLINLLTLEELSDTLPKTLLTPRCIAVKRGQTFFLAGLGRIDYVEGESVAAFMVFSSRKLPVSVVETKLADEFYQNYLGTEVLKVPFGDWERLKDFPAMKPKEIHISSIQRKECCADIVLSSAGWVSVNFSQRMDTWGKFVAYTPEGRGIYVRKPALLQHSILQRGKRIKRTPFCHPSQMVE